MTQAEKWAKINQWLVKALNDNNINCPEAEEYLTNNEFGLAFENLLWAGESLSEYINTSTFWHAMTMAAYYMKDIPA